MNINLGISLAGLNDVFIHKETTPSAAVTGTLTETQVYALTIPANSFSAGDKFVLDNLIVSKTGTAGTASIRVKLSTSSTLPAGTDTDNIANPVISANQIYFGVQKAFNVNGGVIIGNPLNTAAGWVQGSTVAVLNKAFDPTVTNYLYISVILGNVGDSVTVHGYTLKNF